MFNDDPQQAEAAVSVLPQWAFRDFDGATAWVEQIPEGASRDRAINELAGVKSYRQATQELP